MIVLLVERVSTRNKIMQTDSAATHLSCATVSAGSENWQNTLYPVIITIKLRNLVDLKYLQVLP